MKWVIAFALFATLAVANLERFVDTEIGRDQDDCGFNFSSPCQSLSQVSRMNRNFLLPLIIFSNGNDKKGEPIVFYTKVTIIAFPHFTISNCPEILLVEDAVFSGVQFGNEVENITLTLTYDGVFENCTFYDTLISSGIPSHTNLIVVESQFIRSSLDLDNVDAHILRSTFSSYYLPPISLNGGKIQIDQCSFAEGFSSLTLNRTSLVNISNSEFQNNVVVQSDGGALRLENIELVILKNSTFTKNRAQNGGAFALFNVTRMDVEDLSIHNNSATFGGALKIAGGNLIINGVLLLSNNTAEIGGGAYISDATLKAPNLIANSNFATKGGGFYILRSQVDGIQANQNEAKEGGGLHLNESTLCNIQVGFNTAKRFGGIYETQSRSKSSFKKTIVQNNLQSEGNQILISRSFATCKVADDKCDKCPSLCVSNLESIDCLDFETHPCKGTCEFQSSNQKPLCIKSSWKWLIFFLVLGVLAGILVGYSYYPAKFGFIWRVQTATLKKYNELRQIKKSRVYSL